MDPQIIESLGWLFLMLYFPLQRISEKKLENMYIYIIFSIITSIIIFYCFHNANYPLFLSIFLALFYIVIMFMVPEDSSLKKYRSLDEPREFFILLIITFAFLLVGFYFKTYIFVISGYIYLVLTFFQYINDVYLDAESPPKGPPKGLRDRLKFRSGLHLYISSISILFILESFGISDVFGVIDTISIHWLYSTIAQVFSALLGIIILIGVFIFNSKGDEYSKKRLGKALMGFTILYIILILLSIIGIPVHYETDIESKIIANNIDFKLDTIIPNVQFEDRQLPDSNQIVYTGLFTIIVTLIFSSFIYLYEFIRIMIEWGSRIETRN